ncbi:putative 50S ribosomal protein L3 [Neospora caninum Liverpool]|nr:putative 50S ribosomal protein L3 [Neospora caninum Liverpool]CBZ52031.1 putative 50S ribosomal protein L3 [Neospora caninum Liverpool]|eukprot:XP_003882063.1 putative 50S ribosomal protein L3 [Neospora caninum Liverpool]
MWGELASAKGEMHSGRSEECWGESKTSLPSSRVASSLGLAFVSSSVSSSCGPRQSWISPLSSSLCSFSSCAAPAVPKQQLSWEGGSRTPLTVDDALSMRAPLVFSSSFFAPSPGASGPLTSCPLTSCLPSMGSFGSRADEGLDENGASLCYPGARRRRGARDPTALQMIKKYVGLRAPDDPRDYLFDIRWPDQKPEVELLARKIDMTACFSPDGQAEPVTLLQVIPATIVQFLEYGKAVVSYDAPKRRRLFVKRPVLGKLQRVGATGFETATLTVRPPNEFVLGQVLDVSSLMGAKHVHVRALKKAKGFQGIVSRHGFHRGPMTHGSTHHRGPGSVGAGTDPGRVLPGTRMAGRDKAKYATVRNLRVLGFNPKQNLLIVRGSVPGWDMRTVVHVVWERWREECIEDRSRLIEKEREDRLKLVGAVKSSGVKSAKNVGPKKGGGKKKK